MPLRRFFCALMLLVTAGIWGCAGNNPVFTPATPGNPGNAILYLYRPEASTPGVAKPLRFSYPEVFVDGRSVGVIPYDRYLALELAPGQHELRLTGLTAQAKDWEIRDIRRQVAVQRGQSHFLRFGVEYRLHDMNMLQPKSQYTILLTPVSSENAEYEIRHIRQQPTTR